MMRLHLSAAAALLLAFCLVSSVTATEKQASTGTAAGSALTEKDVTRIKITQSVNLEDFSAQLKSQTNDGANPITISRNVELYADSTNVIFDFAFLAGQFVLAPGVTVQFTRLQLQRAESGIPLGIFKSSPGATVKLQDCNNRLKVCAPTAFSLAFFTTVARPPGGVQQAYVDGSGALVASDVVFTVPTTPSGLGGYTLALAGTKLTCDATASLPVGSCLELPAAPSQDCNVAVRGAIKQMLCGASGCINSCTVSCSF